MLARFLTDRFTAVTCTHTNFLHRKLHLICSRHTSCTSSAPSSATCPKAPQVPTSLVEEEKPATGKEAA